MLEYNYAGTRGWRLGPMNSFGGEFVLMTWFNEPFLRIHHLTGRLIACAPAAAPVDATIAKGRFSPWLDESTGELKFRIRRSDGSYVTATIPYK